MRMDGVLRTRLLPPRLPPGCVPRPALVRAVRDGLRGRLVAVVAGAGYGKSTLLAQALAESELPWVWCSCDRRLEDPGQFLAHIAAGIRARFPGFGAELRIEGSVEQQVAALTNEVVETIADDFVVALDDFHLLPEPALEALALLVSDLAPNAHLALAGRAPLPFPLGRLRAARVVEIGEDRLAFDRAEAGQLVRSMGLDADRLTLESLHRRTEGWPAGLILAAQSGGDSGWSARRAEFDYLAEEVLSRQPADVQEFLLDTAVLGRFSPDLAAAVSGRRDADELCRRLVSGHLFAIRLDDPGEWYRYHHLLQAFLRDRLEADDPERMRARNLAAAEWWLAAGEPGEAVGHLLRARDLVGAVDALVPVAERMVLTHESATLAGWLDEIPRELWTGRPALLLAHVGLLLHRAEHESAFAEAEQTIERLIALGDHDRASAALVRLQQAMITAGARPERRIRAGRRFCPRIDARSPLLPVSRILLATAYGYGCRFDEARRELRDALEEPAGASGALSGYAGVARAFYIDLWTGRPQDALAHLGDAVARLQVADPDDALSFRLFAEILRSYMLLELGRFEQVLELIERLREDFRRRGAEAVLLRSYRWVASTALAGLGRWDELAARFESPPRAADPDDAISYSYRYRSPAALLAAHRGDAGEVILQVTSARDEMRSFGSAFDDSWFLCDFALAAGTAGLAGLARTQARDALAAARRLGSPWVEARASLVAAHVGEGADGGDGHLAHAVALTREHRLEELWSAREAMIAPALVARALGAGLGPPGAAEAIAAACGGRAIEAALAAADVSDGPLRARLAEIAGEVADIDIALVDRLMRDRDQRVRQAARTTWARLKARPRAAISIRLLGGFHVQRDGVAVPPTTFVRVKARALLACLVAAGGPLHREALCDRLWPDLPPERAAASLRSTLYDLRRAVEPELETGSPQSILMTDGDVIRLQFTDRDRCDVDEFERLCSAADDGDIEALRAAEALYGGPFAPDWPYDDWAATRRAELEEAFTDVVARLAGALVQAGRPNDAVSRYRRLLAREPEREGWHRDLMRAYAAAGERPLALRQYHACRTVLRREQGIEPDRETRALYAQVLHDAPPAEDVMPA